ncbi:MAG: hypothetical protein DRH49_00135 [Candidatus Coatesbacteria bacterium]|nr:MAG: hypothetical protein DRH49_00135 [Candidatus Coatesbacteria bacterium]
MFGLLTRALLVLVLLFGVLFAVVMALGYYLEWSTMTIVLITVGIVALQYLLGPFIIQTVYRIRWINLDELPMEVRNFIVSSCQKDRIKLPRIGIIDDGNPNAFTFGHYPSNARLVLTRGLLERLNTDEVNAVVGHELGHIVHWDFVVMTLASVVPLFFYIIFITMLWSRGGNRRSRGGTIIVGLASFLLYIITQYVVLLLSRIREYYADEHSAELTQNPNLLASSLVKIAYGLAEKKRETEESVIFSRKLNAIKSLGIFDPSSARNLAVASAGTEGFTLENMGNAMKWDLCNPWASMFELRSTHPLPAKRIKRLGNMSKRMGKAPLYDFVTQKQESFFGEFMVDVMVKYAPFITFVIIFIASVIFIPYYYVIDTIPLIAFSLGNALAVAMIFSLLKTRFKYPVRGFPERKIEDLLGEVKVSGMRPVPATLKGEIIGRGIPGLFLSEDMVLEDETGFIVIDYKQPLSIANMLFGLVVTERMIGRSVVAEGWYRRAPTPHLEMYHLRSDGDVWKGYTRMVRIILAIIGLITGIAISGYIFIHMNVF